MNSSWSKMIELLKSRGVSDGRVLESFSLIDRRDFVPQQGMPFAYDDRPLSIDCGQTISQPYIVALMTELAELKEHHRVLEIGTGSGYQAAILSMIVKEVYTIECFDMLYQKAIDRFDKLKLENIFSKLSHDFKAWIEKAPFDAIIVTAAAHEYPNELIEQLAVNGKLIVPMDTQDSSHQDLLKISKNNTSIEIKKILPVRFVPILR